MPTSMVGFTSPQFSAIGAVPPVAKSVTLLSWLLPSKPVLALLAVWAVNVKFCWIANATVYVPLINCGKV